MRAALPAHHSFFQETVLFSYGNGWHMGLRGHSQLHSFLGRSQHWLWVRNQFGKRSGDLHPESTTLPRVSAPVRLGEKRLCSSSQGLWGTQGSQAGAELIQSKGRGEKRQGARNRVHKGSAKALSWSWFCWGFALESNSGLSEVPGLAIH